MGTLDNNVVLLTGGLGSLGRAQAVKLAAAGAQVLLLDRPNADRAEEITASLAAEAEGRITYVGCDLNQLEATEAQVAALAKAYGGIDILVNNAAFVICRPFEEFSISEYEEQIRVNSSSCFVLARACAPGMKAKGRGAIVNFCSITLNGRFANYVPYVASKGAMLGLTKSLARELGPFGIRVNAISPGAVVSEAERRAVGDNFQDYEAGILDNQCLKVRVEPHHVADLVHFLVSPASSLISGQHIGIDGGW